MTRQYKKIKINIFKCSNNMGVYFLLLVFNEIENQRL